ncbi:hypothetical protein N7493_011770 [Penicillium malachiteum]|uniref:Uncharacterized protein n=1 Tax=Penicillium malachiteum TaxID=1324776 RepID=A0AAD6HAF2_9EURO|nr:hypothetical protein N7493_011770 [Penicillium malachiteum]
MTSERVEIPADQEKEEKEEKPGPLDLWKEAFDSLDPSSQAYISVGDISATAAIDRIIQEDTCTAKYEEWKRGGLKIRRKDADDINIQKSVEKIISATRRAL